MKNTILITFSITALILTGCNSNPHKADTRQQAENATANLTAAQIQAASFNELFKTIEAKDVQEDIFTLINNDYSVLTAGTPSHYNSMVASWGGWGILFDKPVTFSFLRSNRYTLELIRKENKYTMTFFDEKYQEDIMSFGMSSGRENREKMSNTPLTAVQTPSGNMTYKQAKLIIELELFQVTTVSPGDFLNEEAREFVVDAHAETNEYHKIVFGEIKNIWTRK